MRRGLGRLLVGLTLLALLGCTQVRNPATGELQYTSLTPEDEKKLGREENPKALAQFGGRYEDATLSAYVEKVGNRVKNASELADQPFTFTVLDSDVVNAFALPGGYVNVTRGLLALTNNEAELAGVLGHEIGHVTARHTAQRYDQAQVGQLGATAAQLAGLLLGGYLGGSQGAQLGGQAAGQIGSLGAQAYVQGYSREQEFQADQLGIRYLGAAGYDPGAMATFLATLQAEDAYQQRTAGGQGEDSPLGDWFRSHPRTPERVARAVEAVNLETPGARETGRPALLVAIDGMLYGEDPAQGVIRGRSFQHPQLRIGFEAPPGFKLQNSPRQVAGADGKGRYMVFDMAEGAGGDLLGYLQGSWISKQHLQDLQSVDLGGREAAVGFGRVTLGSRPAQAMFAAVRGQGSAVYRFIYADTGGFDRSDLADFEQSLRTFRTLSAAEIADLKPMRLRVVPVGPGDTLDSFARRMQVPADTDPRALFVLLNGLDRGREMRPGDQVKIITMDSRPLTARADASRG
ncbi:MAG: M48 family metalloprotease [Geminicoccaceae bacterium]